MRCREFEKTYLAVLTAVPEPERGELRHWLAKDGVAHVARITQPNVPGAKEAALAYEVLAVQDGLCLVRVRLLTGRFHQIRAQFADIGCSVYGDMKYGPRNVKAPLALHACRLCLVHPTQKKRCALTARLSGRRSNQFDIPEV